LIEQTVDHEAEDRRTRERIRGSLNETLFVEAGAGTGKTSALVDRVVALVLGGRSIEELAAVTFTEKAAAELRDRVRSELERAAKEQPEHAGVIEAALASLDRAQVSTIHSFCQGLLYSHAAEAGIDPSFRVQDEVAAERRFQERWRIYLEGLAGDDEAQSVVDRALRLGLTTRDLESLASELMSRSELAAVLETASIATEAPEWPDLRAAQASLEGLVPDFVPADDKLRQAVERLASLVNELVRPGADREAVLAAGAEVLTKSYNVSNQQTWGKRAIDDVRVVAAGIRDSLNETLRRCRAEALRDVMPFVVRFVLGDAVERGREGTLTFDDLILRVRDLLRGNQEAVRALRGRFKVMLIDEFQDTDPLQVDIARSFATEPESGRLEAGRLFLVGDPKQSIYRFRRADMAVYSRTRELVEAEGAGLPALALNRRSRQVILDWVNAIFTQLIGPGWDQSVQPPYRPIHSPRSEEVPGPGVAWIGGEVADANARDVREMEAAAIAAQCVAAVEEGWQVVDRDRSVRPGTLKDIAVLIPARTILPALERALSEAGVPYRVESGSLIYRTQEVRDLLNCLTAIDDPGDEVAVVAALRSPAFACSDVDLARHKASGGTWNYLSSRLDGAQGRVADGLRSLAAYHKERHDGSLAALVERFVGDRGQVEVGILDLGNRDSFRRARFVAEQARAFEAEGLESLRSFVNWMERRAGKAILDNEGAGLDDDEDAVRVLTIHGAKGLEFPMVFVAGMGSGPSNRPGTYLVDRSSGEIAVCAGTKTGNRRFELGPVQGLVTAEQNHTDAEYARLLYVATTRARDHLVVSLYHSKRASTCGARRLMSAGAQQYAERRPDVSAPERPTPRRFEDLDPGPAEWLTADEFKEGRERLVAAARQRRYTSATAIGQFKKDEGKDESEPWARGRGGTRLGRAVHAAIQSLPFDADDATIAAFARAQAVAEAIPHRAGDVERLVRWVLRSSQAAVRARSARRALREVPFAVAVNGAVLEGFIDLVIETEGAVEIVDWKTDQIGAAEVDDRLRGYKTQAGLYVYGLEAATGRRVSAVTYVFASAEVEVSPGEPATLSKEAQLELMRPLTD